MKTETTEDYSSKNQKNAEDNTQKEKIIVETKIEYNCEESVRKYHLEENIESIIQKLEKIEEENNQSIIQKILNMYIGAVSYVDETIQSYFLSLSAFGWGSWVYRYLNKKEENKTQLEDYITFDKKIIIYNDGSTEIQKINIKNQTRVVPE